MRVYPLNSVVFSILVFTHWVSVPAISAAKGSNCGPDNLMVVNVSQTKDSSVLLSWCSEPDVFYDIFFAEGLVPEEWQLAQIQIPSQGLTTEFTDSGDPFLPHPSLVSQRLYRAAKQTDTDLDGLTDAFEILVTGTHPNKSDSDGDGLIDFFEDSDGNGVPNFQEYQVLGKNDPPTILNPGPQTGKEDVPGKIDLDGISAGGGKFELGQIVTLKAISGDTNLMPHPVIGPIINGKATLSYKPNLNENGTVEITIIADDGQPINNTKVIRISLTIEPVNDPPVVLPLEPFEVIGNVGIAVPDGSSDLLSVVMDIDGPIAQPFFVGGVIPVSTVQGGTISINPVTGAFTYTPPPGFEGSDSFKYQVCDSGEPGSACSSPVTVTLNVNHVIWFIDNSHICGACDGRLGTPFNSLSMFNGIAADEPGDLIFIHSGFGPYVGGIVMLENQILIGQGATASIPSIAGITLPIFSKPLPIAGGLRPVIINPSGNGIILSQNNTIRGLNIGNTSGTGIIGTSVGSSTLSQVSINGTGAGLNISTGTLAYSLDEISSSNAIGISLNNVGGSLNVSTGTINSGTSTAINIDGSPSLSLGVNLTSVSSSGGSAVGISLQDTTGSFTITGSGTTAGSGGTIANKTGANLATNQGIGIFLSNVTNVSLSNMQLNDFSNFAIRGSSVSGFTFSDSLVSGVNGNSNGDDEGSISFLNLTGTVLIEGSNIAGGHEDNINILNTATGTLTMNVQDSASKQMIIGLNSNASGNDGILLETQNNASAALNVLGVEFLGARGDMIQANSLGTSTQNITIQNNTFFNSHGNIVSGGGGITLSGGSESSNVSVTYNVSNNQFTGARGNAITANWVNGGGVVTGTIGGNTIGTPGSGATSVGSSEGSGISIGANSTVVHNVTVSGNTIRDVIGFSGIDLLANNGSTLNALIDNNTVAELSGGGGSNFILAALYAIVGGASSSDTAVMNLDINNNLFDAGGAPSGANAVFFDQISTLAHYNFPSYTGSTRGEFATPSGTASAGLNTYLTGRGNNFVNGAFPYFAGGVDAGVARGITNGAFPF